MAARSTDSTSAALVSIGIAAFVAGAFAIFIGILLASDEPSMAKPWITVGLALGFLGVGLLVAGLLRLVDSVRKQRR